jgi:hypothetical protein
MVEAELTKELMIHLEEDQGRYLGDYEIYGALEDAEGYYLVVLNSGVKRIFKVTLTEYTLVPCEA